MDYEEKVAELKSFCGALSHIDPYAHVWVLASASLELLEHRFLEYRCEEVPTKSPTYVRAEEFLHHIKRWAGSQGAIQSPIMAVEEDTSFCEAVAVEDLLFVAHMMLVFRGSAETPFWVGRIVADIVSGLARGAPLSRKEAQSRKEVASSLLQKMESQAWPTTNPQAITHVTSRSDPSAASIWVTWDVVAAHDYSSIRLDQLRLAWLRCLCARRDWKDPLVRATFERLVLMGHPSNTPIESS